MQISVSTGGSTNKTEAWLKRLSKVRLQTILNSYGVEGVRALEAATPRDSGLAANSWSYKVTVTGKSATIVWTNNDVENGFPVAIMLQHGYATGTGGYVAGRDYINPAMKPVFDKISAAVWREVTNG